MKEKSNNRNEQATVFNYHPHPVKKRFLAFLFAAALFVALAACNNESGGEDDGGGGNAYYGLGTQNSVYTVTFDKGNGAGTPTPTSKLVVDISKNNKITLPGVAGLRYSTDDAANAPTKFVGWNDGLLTYPPGYKYTVTKNVTFNARWAFDTLDKIEAYLKLPQNTVLIAVAPNDSDLTWKNLLRVIEEANKNVELDLSGSILALSGGNFDYKDVDDTSVLTGVNNIRKLILPVTAKSITNIFYDGITVPSDATFDITYDSPYDGLFSNLEAVSGLNVNAIPSNAFYRLSKLEAVAFSAATSIDNWAFRDCTGLIEVNLPAATSIGDSAFRNCSELYKASLPAAISIDVLAFYNCTGLTSVSLPAAKYIGERAFESCTGLTSVSLPVATSIGERAFNRCINLTNLTSVSLPAATSIGMGAFSSCTRLTSVSLPAAKSIGDSAFEYCFYLTSVSLPAAKSIDARAFEYCYYLTSLSLPAAASIHERAFTDCTSLTTITIAEDCNITDDSGMHQDFKTYYYTEKGRVAGVYTYNFIESSWSYKAL